MSSEQGIISKLMAHCYPKLKRDALHAAFSAYVRPGMKVLDAGCGDTLACSRKGPWHNVFIIGVDHDSAVHGNTFCNETLVCDLLDLPFADASFDLIHCRWVIEHLEDPLKTFQEFARVLKPGGHLLALTPNLFHYATFAARLTPHRFHRWWLRRGWDPFPTYYRANYPRRLRRLCIKAGLQVQQLKLIEGPPHYFIRYWPAFLCGVVYERIVNSTQMLKWFRQRIFFDAVVPYIQGCPE